jgi:UTP--glucose-1-phosphate uridylyltransferase
MPAVVRKALLPAAGFGTRSLPATKAIPKEMMTLVDRPLIQYAVEEAVASGVDRIGIVIAAWKTAIARHFGPNPELEAFLASRGRLRELEEVRRVERLAEFTFIDQPEPRGLGQAVAMGEDFAAGEPVAVLNPDVVYDGRVPCLRQLLDVFEARGKSVVVLGRIGPEETKHKGVARVERVADRVFRILDLVEKPGPEKAFSDLAVLGRYVFTPGIFAALGRTGPGYGGEIQLTDAIRILLADEPVYGVMFEGRRFDAGDRPGFLEATVELGFGGRTQPDR